MTWVPGIPESQKYLYDDVRHFQRLKWDLCAFFGGIFNIGYVCEVCGAIFLTEKGRDNCHPTERAKLLAAKKASRYCAGLGSSLVAPRDDDRGAGSYGGYSAPRQTTPSGSGGSKFYGPGGYPVGPYGPGGYPAGRVDANGCPTNPGAVYGANGAPLGPYASNGGYPVGRYGTEYSFPVDEYGPGSYNP